MKKERIVSVRFDEEEYKILKKEADNLGIGTSTLIRAIIKNYIKEKIKKRREDL